MVKSLLEWSTSAGTRPLGFRVVKGACLCSSGRGVSTRKGRGRNGGDTFL